MKTRYRLIRRGNRNGAFYCVDTATGKRTSLRVTSEAEARQMLAVKNQAHHQPGLNLQIAKAYLAGTDAASATRTWQQAIAALTETKREANRQRWQIVRQDPALAPLWGRVIIETSGELLLKILQAGTVSTNVFLRRLHNFCVDMNWLPWPLIPKRQWPPVRFQEKRAITATEHARILARESNPEYRAYYQLAWHLGASQADLASLTAANVDGEQRVIAFARKKSGSMARLRFGAEVVEILCKLPATGPFFPYLHGLRSTDRALMFKKRCVGLGITGVTLHSYRYAWAERAKLAGYPERFAQEALGHNSPAVHRAYARKADVLLPALEEYERDYQQKVVLFTTVTSSEPVEDVRAAVR